ncbi:retrovirus-related pol polyprotein from transposon TNT 1-94 [Tanacetum coccineum]
MTTPITTSTTDSQMHNNIMAASSRDRPPMLATGRYAQWQSRFLRYIDTRPNGDALRKCILQGPYTPSTVTIPPVPATNNTPAVPERTSVETILNMSPENKAHYESEKEAIHLLLTGIGNEIYSTIDTCRTTHKMWITIERLQQGESLNIQDVKTNLFWEFGKFTSHDGETMESYYSRFYKMMNEMIRNNLIVATMQVNVQFLQQLQPEWSRFVTIVKQQHGLDTNANPLALIAATSPYPDPYYQAPKSHKPYATTSKQSSSTKSNASTKFKGKEIAKPIIPLSELASEVDSDPEQAQRDKDMQKNLALIAKYFKKIYKPTNNNLRPSSNSENKNVDTSPRDKNDNQTRQFGNQRTVTVAGARETVRSQVVQQTGIQCFNCKEFGHFAKECRKPKRVKDFTCHKEKMLLYKQAEKGVPLQVEKSDWLAETDEKIDKQELEAHSALGKDLNRFLCRLKKCTEPLETVSLLQDLEFVKHQCFNCKEFGHFAKECKKPKRLADMDEDIDEQELEAHYSFMAKIQEVSTADSGTDTEPLEQVQFNAGYNVFANERQHSEQPESISNTCVVEKVDSNVIHESPDICDNNIQTDQNVVECDDKRVALANLIANLKLYVDENKNIQTQLKKANTSLAHELKECKSILEETSRTLGSLIVFGIVV